MYEYRGTHRDGSFPNDGDLLVRPNGIIFSLEMDATHVSYKADPGILSDSSLFSLSRYVRGTKHHKWFPNAGPTTCE